MLILSYNIHSINGFLKNRVSPTVRGAGWGGPEFGIQ